MTPEFIEEMFLVCITQKGFSAMGHLYFQILTQLVRPWFRIPTLIEYVKTRYNGLSVP